MTADDIREAIIEILSDIAPDEDLSGLREVRVGPWLVCGMDSGPCSIVGQLY